MTKPGRAVVIIAVVVLALVACAVLTVLVLAPSSSHFAPDSPEAAFQRYLNAFDDRDFSVAYDAFSMQAQRQLSPDEYTRRARTFGDGTSDENQRILIERVERHDSAVTLHITIEHVSGSGLELNRWSYEQAIPLVREDGTWKIDQLLLGVSPLPPGITG